MLIMGLALAQTTQAQVDWAERMAEAAMPIREDFSGPGWDWLVEQAQAADYLLVGEDHGVAQVPQLCGALYEGLVDAGYHHLVIETGPFTGRLLNELTAVVGTQAIEALLEQDPFSLPFYTQREEYAFLQKVRSLSPAEAPLVGIDQELVASPRMLLGAYATQFSDANLLAAELSLARAGYNKLVEEKNPGDLWMFAATEKRLEALRAVAKGEVGIQIIDELVASRDIYNYNNTGEYHASNLTRSQLMKKHFWTFREAHPEGKVMVKLGAFHAMRGYSFTHVQDIGNSLSEEPGATSFHVAILPMGGVQNRYTPFSSEEARQAPVDSSMLGALVELTESLLPESGYVIIPLAQWRGLVNALPEDFALRKLFYGFDAVILVPESTASTGFR
ncbi:MAG TPA: hypothetical protein DCE41_38015 [Cytophagales bacterium]|nr:hypothetical protein [Cytophagales bacterium]HAA20689.1 hypothetical protein [Cytophagales bacterium]HAP65143.1 hypothetical protein [Cytophagales bacterium]